MSYPIIRKLYTAVFYIVSILLIPQLTYSSEADITTDLDQIKSKVLQLNSDLYTLERELLSPLTTRAAFHLSLLAGEYFEPLSLQLSIDDNVELRHIYTEREVMALKLGAVHPIGDVNVAPGDHQVSILVKGVDMLGQPRELLLEDTFNKTSKPLLTELRVIDIAEKQAARLELVAW